MTRRAAEDLGVALGHALDALAATIFRDGHFTLEAARAYLRAEAIAVRAPR